jgi:hypothetical protein
MFNPNSKRRRIKPFARPTSFDYNVRFDIRQYQDVKYGRVRDPYFGAAANDEAFRVMEGELLVKKLDSSSRYNDKELHVFSFANGLRAPEGAPIGGAEPDFAETTTNTKASQIQVRKAILKSIQYMGVAVTEFNPAADAFQQGFVATIAGLNTLFNNGADTIYPGCSICLDLPVLRTSDGGRYGRALQTGVPREKLQFIVRPRDAMMETYGDADLVNRCIIGTAISYSRAGDTLDVILHRMNYSTSHNPKTISKQRHHVYGLDKLVANGKRAAVEEGLVHIAQVIEEVDDHDLNDAYSKANGAVALNGVLAKARALETDLIYLVVAENIELADRTPVDDTNINDYFEEKLKTGKQSLTSDNQRRLWACARSIVALTSLAGVAAQLDSSLMENDQKGLLGLNPLNHKDDKVISNGARVMDHGQIPQLKAIPLASSTKPIGISAAVGAKPKKKK